ncbi:MAG: hypothetical protein IT537_16480 [Hyphomicrobiales bacterium]|nr:hypothetical protein [Hyphomicrobiales bacterium]
MAVANPATERTIVLSRSRSVVVLLVLLAYAFTLWMFYPGYVTVDARYVYADAQSWQFGDWQSPVMGALWRLIDPLAPGAASMFLLTATLYWLAFGLLAWTVARHSRLLAVLAVVLGLSPPAFFFVGMIWRDIQFGVLWLAAAAMVLAVAAQPARRRWPIQVIALALVALGVLLRPNAIFAAPFLAAYAVWPTRFELKRMALVLLPGVLAFYALVPLVYYGVLHAKRQNPLHSILVFDLGGITYFSGDNQFPVDWDGEQTELLRTKCYDPVRWDSYWHVPPCPFVMQRLERTDDLVFGTPRLPQAWVRAVLQHPLAYLAHRAAFMGQFLARSNLVLPVWDWLAPSSTYGRTAQFGALVTVHDALQPTIVFRPGVWLILAIAIGALGWRERASPAGAFVIAVSVAAVIYVLTFFPLGVAADFRYAYWCVLATLAGAIALVLARLERPAA